MVLIEKLICIEVLNDPGSFIATNTKYQSSSGKYFDKTYYGTHKLSPRYGKHLWVFTVQQMPDASQFELGIITKDKYETDYSNFFGFKFRCNLPPIISIPTKTKKRCNKIVKNISWDWQSGFLQPGDIIEVELYLFEISISVLTSSKRIDTKETPVWKHCNLKLSDCDEECRLCIKFKAEDNNNNSSGRPIKKVLKLKEYSVNWM